MDRERDRKSRTLQTSCVDQRVPPEAPTSATQIPIVGGTEQDLGHCMQCGVSTAWLLGTQCPPPL